MPLKQLLPKISVVLEAIREDTPEEFTYTRIVRLTVDALMAHDEAEPVARSGEVDDDGEDTGFTTVRLGLWTSNLNELRIANNGVAYPKHEFLSHYGIVRGEQYWESARPVKKNEMKEPKNVTTEPEKVTTEPEAVITATVATTCQLTLSVSTTSRKKKLVNQKL